MRKKTIVLKGEQAIAYLQEEAVLPIHLQHEITIMARVPVEGSRRTRIERTRGFLTGLAAIDFVDNIPQTIVPSLRRQRKQISTERNITGFSLTRNPRDPIP